MPSTTSVSASAATAAPTKANVFDMGNYTPVLQTVETGSTLPVPPPKPLLIAMPSEAGEFPVIIVLHGWMLYNSFYSQLIQHIASYGFIVVAPQASLSLSHSCTYRKLTCPSAGHYFSKAKRLTASLPQKEEESLESGAKGSMQMIFLMKHAHFPKHLVTIPANSILTERPCACVHVILIVLYTCAGVDATADIDAAAAVTDWLSEGLHYSLPAAIQPDLTKLGLAGHSRGGKAAFALALGKAATSLKFSALVGMDPVDGDVTGRQTPPKVLTYIPHSFLLGMAAMVIGSGFGELKKCHLFPACAPKRISHEEFFNECQEPACYFVVKDYGHLDMLNDDTTGIRGLATYCMCKNGESREPMRRFVGGIVVAFMKAYLPGDKSDLMAIRDGLETAPVELTTIEFLA
ncbi:Chlorophyllase-2, chloroplastic [Morella rubra]|uniref:Chlorophyllase-2, chloroplastic n=1 Tax=Morella rubra TaxID=262757 RepID=A0A6A1VYT2_9ROSI|nr:Chlorophyllase-2, chloroplastic [Morella rubra]